MAPAGRVHIGCSGWQYQHWRGDFYPAELPQSRWFAHYALTFDTVEINNSFYRLPAAETFAKWRGQAPRRFVYAVKASRYLTHMKKLKDPEDPLHRSSARRGISDRISARSSASFRLDGRWTSSASNFF